jgi:hypothetical protein
VAPFWTSRDKGVDEDARQILVGFSYATGTLENRVLTAVIRWFTGGPATHTFLLVPSSVHGWTTLGANADGVGYIPLDQFIRTRRLVAAFSPRRESLWTGLGELSKDVGAPYNYGGLLGMAYVEAARRWFDLQVSRNPTSERRALFCSQFVAEVVRASGLSLGLHDDPASTLAPEELLNAMLGNPLWEMCPLDRLVA